MATDGQDSALAHNSQSRRVLLLSANLTTGGLERQLALLAANLPDPWRPLVWTADGGPFEEVLARTGVPHVVDRRRSRLDPSPFAKLWRLIVACRPDVVHAWHWMPASAALPLCRLLDIPFVDGSIRLGRPGPEFGQPRSAVMRFADVVVANSRAGLLAWGFAPPKGRVVHNAFDPARLAIASDSGADVRHAAVDSADARRFTVVMTGRMFAHKDFRVVVEAARDLARRGEESDWRFLLVGEGPLRASLEACAGDLVAAGIVEFLRPGLEVLPIVARADVGVLMTNDAAHAEGCSNSIMEYMACGLPVVCSDGGGNRELVEDGVTGYVVPSGDSRALADRLETLRSARQSAELGASGRERLLRDFSLERMVGAYVSIYDECLTYRGGARRGRHH
jgi:glycosyltransferase involved in cell wall biosynthesis